MDQATIFPATGMPDKSWWRALWPDPESVIRSMLIQPGMIVTDLGCGDGYFTASIARQVGQGRVIAVDIDPVMLDQAKVACASLKNCDWLLGNAMELHLLLHDLVDYVLIANTFHGAPDKTELAREIGRVLKSKGRLAIINWYPLPREETVILGKPRGPATALRMSPEQTEAAVEPAGYKLEKRVEFPPYHYGAIFLRTS